MATMINRNGVEMLLVNTTNGVDVPPGFAFISANLRETKGSNIPAEQKHRNIVIPEFVLPDCPKQYVQILTDKFYNLAKARLEAVMEETNRMARELPLSDFTPSALIEFFGRVAVSSRLTGEAVGAWFDASATGKYISEKVEGDAAKLKKYRDLFVKTASPNHGINPNTCTVLLATLQESDKESTVYESLAGKWQATIEKSQQSEVDSL